MALDCQADLFEVPGHILYFNCAAQGPAPKRAADAGRRAVERKSRPWEKARQDLSAEMERTRVQFAALINGDPECVALTGATSYGIAIAARNMKLVRGQAILVLESQFPSNYYAWQRLAAARGGTLRVVKRLTDGDWTSAVLEALAADSNIGVVTLPQVHWVDGGVLDLARIAPAVHALGAGFVIDATQSIGAMPFDVASLDPDFVTCSAYKWLLSPDQTGYLYVAPRHLDGEPVEHNHAARVGTVPMTHGPGYGDRFKPGARRYDQGAADAMIHMPMAVAAMDQLLAWGVPEIGGYLAPIIDRIADQAELRGWSVPPKAHRSPHFIGLSVPHPVASDLDVRLAKEDVYLSLRDGRIRIAPHLFNRVEQVEALFAALDRHLRKAA